MGNSMSKALNPKQYLNPNDQEMLKQVQHDTSICLEIRD